MITFLILYKFVSLGANNFFSVLEKHPQNNLLVCLFLIYPQNLLPGTWIFPQNVLTYQVVHHNYHLLEKSSQSLCPWPISGSVALGSVFVITLDSSHLSSDWTTYWTELGFPLSWFAPLVYYNTFFDNVPRKVACIINVLRVCMFENILILPSQLFGLF